MFYSYRNSNKFREKTVNTLCDLYNYSTSRFENNKLSKLLGTDIGYTYKTFKQKCDEMSRFLSRYGIGADDKVAILSQNLPNWTVAFFALVPFGRIAVPILPDCSENEITNILTHSGSKAIFITKRLLPKLSQAMRDKLNLVIDIETFDIIQRNDSTFTCDGRVVNPVPDDIAALIYTSGTTGNAKGVMLTHRNLISNIKASYHTYKCNDKARFMSILPMAHTYEMSIGMLYSIYSGACTYYISKPPTPTILLKALKEAKPTIMLSVPLIIEKIYHGSIVPTIKKSRVLRWLNKNAPWLLYKLIGLKLKKLFGGHLGFFGIGGSKLDSNVEAFLKKSGFPYAIGYGLTETAPLICGATPYKTVIGSTGPAVYNIQVKLIDVNPETGEGEIVVKGDQVMAGYYKDPERTKAVFTEDGWFRTNDLAVMDDKGRYYIKGRLNNMILGPSGENIYPEEIEQVINNMDEVHESLVMERNGQLVALVHMDENIIDWDQEGEDKFFEMVEARKKLMLNYINKYVNKSSKINVIELMKEPFEKTATQKIRRFKYKDQEGDDVKAGKKREQQEQSQTNSSNNDNKL